nr:hypothetical protein [Tanacetum cinerariifolium]
MYPCFIQLIIQTNIANLSKHTNRYISPILTQKVFANMRRVGKGFSRVETPLFETMLAVRDIAEEAEVFDTCFALTHRVEGLENANAAQQLEIVKLQARDEGIELVVDQEKDAEIEGGMQINKQRFTTLIWIILQRC